MALITIARGRVYNFSHVVGARASGQTPDGMGAPGLNRPNAIAVGKDGVVYVLNRQDGSRDNPRVAKIKIGGPSEERYLLTIGRGGSEDGQFMWPAGVALDKDENLYVSDDYLHHVSIFDKEGKFLGKWGTPGNDPGELNGPNDLAFDGENNVYVVDAFNHRVQKFTKDGVFLGGWGHYGSGEGEFNMPWGIDIDDKGAVYVADWKNHRVQKFSHDGTFLMQIGRPAPGAGELQYPSSFPRHIAFSHLYRMEGANTGELNHPSHVAVDKDGDVYVSDWANDRVQIYTPEGEFFASLYGDAQEIGKWAQDHVGANPDVAKAIRRAKNIEQMWEFKMPEGIGIDHETNRIIIADCFRRRLQIYVKEKDYIDPQFNL